MSRSGDASTIQTLRPDRLTWLTQSVLLPPWGPATRESTKQKSVYKPALSTGIEAFTMYEKHGGVDYIEQVRHEARAREQAALANDHTTSEDRQTRRRPTLKSFIQIAWRWSSRPSWTPTAPFSSARRHLALSNSRRRRPRPGLG